MENPSKTQPLQPSTKSAEETDKDDRRAPATRRKATKHASIPAQGRLSYLEPVAVVDIGSNSVRLVVYEGLNRSPTPFFNEKALCGLGSGVAETGLLQQDAIESALRALRRFRVLITLMQCANVIVVATAAAREAKNGPQFVAEAEAICQSPIRVLTGKQEARMTALGIISGFHEPDGLIGDLGGGSLELIRIKGSKLSGLSSHPLGALRLRDMSGGDIDKAREIALEIIDDLEWPDLSDLPFYAIGGTWRAFAKLHMGTIDYPLHVLHAYRIKSKHAIALCRQINTASLSNLPGNLSISKQRGALLPYGAVVLEAILRKTRAHSMVISAHGVREGLLYTQLDRKTRAEDPLISASREMATLLARSPDHARELCEWTDKLFSLLEPDETQDNRRLRHSACWLADIGWRAHPDYRGEQSLSIIANSAFTGIDHAGRAILALTVFYRHAGFGEDEPWPSLRHLVDLDGVQRAALIGAALRVANRLSASMSGVLPQIGLEREGRALRLVLPPEFGDMIAERLENRIRRLARLAGLEGEIVARKS